MKTIKITCESKTKLSLLELSDFQGELKYRDKIDIDKVAKSILKYGFSFPFFVWRSGTKNYILDGHGRKLALKKLSADGYEIPDLPVIYISADSIPDAKEKLLRINSRFGDITQESLEGFAEGLNFDFGEVDIRVEEALKTIDPVYVKSPSQSTEEKSVYVPTFAKSEPTEESIKKSEQAIESKFQKTVEDRRKNMVEVICKCCGETMLLPKDYIIQKISEMRG